MGTPCISTLRGDGPPGKTVVSFEQLYHEVWCIKDHYPEVVVWESVIWSLKGAPWIWLGIWVPPLAFTIYCTNCQSFLAQKPCLMCPFKDFYKVSQGNNEKVPPFATRLEGTLNQIQPQCPGRMTGLEAQQHLRDCLFQGIRKHICDSIQYL